MDAEITATWPTKIWIGQVSAQTLDQVAAHADPAAETDLSGYADQLAVLADLEDAVTSALGLGPDHRWRHRLAVWPSGFYRGMTYSNAAVRALVIVTSNPPANHEDSGVLSLHDPRIGAANVALPGLPWGRASKIPPMAGGAVAVPGWVGCSVAPLRDTHIMTVWTAEAIPVEP